MLVFCGLRAKCYSILFQSLGVESIVRSKGTKTSVKKKHLKHHLFVDTLKNQSTYSVGQNIIKSRAHEVSSVHCKKIALTAFDVKRWICCDGINTLAHGHFRRSNIKCEGQCVHCV